MSSARDEGTGTLDLRDQVPSAAKVDAVDHRRSSHMADVKPTNRADKAYRLSESVASKMDRT